MFLYGTSPVVQPVHLHRHTRAARARKSANVVSANMASMALNKLEGCGVRGCEGR